MLGSDLSITSSDIGSFPLYTLPGPSGTLLLYRNTGQAGEGENRARIRFVHH